MTKDEYGLHMAEAAAARSKDESTKLGAVVIGPAGEIRSTGYNSFPRGVDDNVKARQQRPLKYKWFVHAEANAIFNAAYCGTQLAGCTIFCRWLPCPNCAMAIIQAGIRHIVVKGFDVPERWIGDMELACKMLSEAGVMVRVPDGEPKLHFTVGRIDENLVKTKVTTICSHWFHTEESMLPCCPVCDPE